MSKRIDRFKIQQLANSLRDKYNIDFDMPIDINLIMDADKNLTLVYYPFDDQLSGICIKEQSLIALNSKHSKGRQNFSFAHELYHLYFDDEYSSTYTISHADSKDINEKNADLFASHFLISDQALQKQMKNKNINGRKLELEDLISLEQYFNVSRQAMLIRLVKDDFIDQSLVKKFSTNVIKDVRNLGYDDSLYISNQEIKTSIGKIVKITNDLYENNKISKGKYEEILLDAFRGDLVLFEESENYEG